jgi:hypothetical protein
MVGKTGFDLEDTIILLQQLQQFYEIIQQEWSQVQNQWGNLRTAWRDEQFDTFNPVYEKLSTTHTDTEQKCEKFIAFLKRQIELVENRQRKIGKPSNAQPEQKNTPNKSALNSAETENPHDKLDEHDLSQMSCDDRHKVFAEEAALGIYRGFKIKTADKNIDFEFDRIDVKKGVIVEDKSAKRFEENPKPLDAIKNWSKKQIYGKTKNKINFINSRPDNVYHGNSKGSSPNLPTMDQVRGIKKFEFRLKVNQEELRQDLMEELKKEINVAITDLKTDYPDWSFDVVFGG